MNEKVKKLIGIILFIGILSFTLYFIFKDQSLSSIIQALLAVNPWFIVLGFFMMILFIACDALKLSLVLNEFDFSVSFLKTLGYAFVGFYFSSITPSASGGQPAQMYYMSKDDIHVSYSSLTLLITTIVYQVATILYGVAMFILNYSFVIDQLYGVKLLLFVSLCINSLMILTMVAIMFSKRFVKVSVYVITIILYKLRLIKDLAATRDKIDIQIGEYTKGANYIKTKPALIIKVILVTIFQMTALYFIPFLVYKAFNLSDYSAFQMIAIQSLLTLAVSALPLPGAMGASENGFMVMFKLFFATNLLIPAMLISRVLSFYSMLLFSGIITLIVHLITHKKKVKSNDLATPYHPHS